MGIELGTELIKVILPTCEKSFSSPSLEFGGDFGNEFLEIRDYVSTKFKVYTKVFA